VGFGGVGGSVESSGLLLSPFGKEAFMSSEDVPSPSAANANEAAGMSIRTRAKDSRYEHSFFTTIPLEIAI
jgi:hypothetical protein